MKRCIKTLETMHQNCGAICEPNHPANAHQLEQFDVPAFLIVIGGSWQYKDVDGFTNVIDPKGVTRYTAVRIDESVIISDLDANTQSVFSTDFIDSNFDLLLNPNNFDSFLGHIMANAIIIKGGQNE